MRYKPEIAGAVLPDGALEQDLSGAREEGKVLLGERCLFFKRFSGTSYLPYGQIRRAWLRQEEVKARLCCGTANFDQFYLVMACADGQERRGHVADKAAGQRCLDHIAARAPEVEIGYVRPKD